MRSRRPSAEHQEAVSRRLALLSAELAEVRPAPDWYDDHTRVRAAEGGPVPATAPIRPAPAVQATVPPGWPAPPEPPGPPGWVPPPVPVPGRHAARRRADRPGRRLAGLLPETLQGRVAIGSAQLTVVSLVVALGLAVTCWWVVRSDPGAPVAPAPVDTSPVADLVEVPEAGPSPAGASSAPAAAEVVVDVAGQVRRPGIVVLEAGARVVDALDAAGGARRGVDLSVLNLARVLVDGEQVRVGAPPGPQAGAVPGAVPGVAPAPGTAAAPSVVDLNTATEAQLDTLPQVGPVTAAAIVAWRTEHGSFSAVEELLEVDGIGEATLAQIAPHVTVAGG
ncbi:helix-hairpin-helix domain-containing protein [Nocardioides sp. SYSU DS0663]|uniref:helix-hairpin-helix domain-containing protein n=1 Tax=Nocardioides sp. SYSU DS0663 TaxID=3416445 RepID=UPI003F4B6017